MLWHAQLAGAVALADKGPHDISSSIEQEHARRTALEDGDPSIRQSPRGDDLVQWVFLRTEHDEWVRFDAPEIRGELGGTRGDDAASG
jgi:hypothetical protein